MNLVRAIYPGSFDPLTNGHLDLIERGSKIFEELIVAILRNSEKDPLFTLPERKEMLQEMVKTLDPREAIILRARFGLDGGPQKTLEEVGQKFGVTRERVRQIQNIALKKLRKMIERMEATKA